MKTRLIRLNENFNGVKDVYEIENYYVNYGDKYIRASVLKKSISDTGIPLIEKLEFTIYNRQTGKVPFRIDPEWNSSSTPAKPEGFVLDDPETWGDLMWEEIPILPQETETYYDDYFSWKWNRPAVYISDDIDEFILRTIVKMGQLPSAEEGWKVEIS